VKRNQRLRSSADFVRTRERAARAWSHPLVVLYVADNELGRTRVGITVSGRVGNAVVRNRVRRRLREAVRARFERLRPGCDVLLVARPASAHATWAELSAALDSVLDRSGATTAVLEGVQAEVNRA
jgi:ribonuclease P protein component